MVLADAVTLEEITNEEEYNDILEVGLAAGLVAQDSEKSKLRCRGKQEGESGFRRVYWQTESSQRCLEAR